MLCNTFPPYIRGGAELMAADLSFTLINRGHIVKVFAGCPRRDCEGSSYRQGIQIEFRYPGSCVLPEPSMNRMQNMLWQIWTHILDLSNPIFVIKLQRCLREFKPDVVHTHNIFGLSPLVWRAVAKSGIPIVHTTHDAWLLCPKGNLFYPGGIGISLRLGIKLYRNYYKRWIPLVDCLCMPSNYFFHLHRNEGIYLKNACVISNGINLPRKIIYRKSKDVNPLRFLFLGQLEPHKGLMTLLNAVASLPKSYLFELHIAGKGSLQNIVEHAVFIDKRIRFHGFVKQEAKQTLLHKTHLLIFPSECGESFGLSILEAMSYGALAVVADLGGQKEIIRPNENGWLFKPGKSEELAKRLEFIIGNPDILNAMSRKSIQDATKYSLSAMADAYEKVYASLVSSR